MSGLIAWIQLDLAGGNPSAIPPRPAGSALEKGPMKARVDRNVVIAFAFSVAQLAKDALPSYGAMAALNFAQASPLRQRVQSPLALGKVELRRHCPTIALCGVFFGEIWKKPLPSIFH